ncbi:hypothetical protein KAU11_00400 [Candidatus Babeliales bacterium]|nr:hypothetical protein [Candidatus Babeliales bacterium]
MKKKRFEHRGTTTGRTQRWGKGDIYNARVDNLSIRGGITPKGEPSIILGAFIVNKKDRCVILKIDGEAKLQAIFECIVAVVSKAPPSKGR